MKPYHGDKVQVHPGDCLDVMAGMEVNSFDSVVTDPPYHFASIIKRWSGDGPPPVEGVFRRSTQGFMGKTWDGGDIAFQPATWAAVLRALKPGAHLVAFGAPKNWHRLVCAIEDAGFEIRDNLLWLFGSGFPKSHDVSKAIDHTLGAKRERIGTKVELGIRHSPGRENETSHEGYKRPWRDDPNADGHWVSTPTSDLAKQYNGFGTALKPAYEPIVLARKPFRGTVAANVIAHGTGALNIDACRIGDGNLRATGTGGMGQKANPVFGNFANSDVERITTMVGRWPANVVHDGSPEVVERFPESDSGDVHQRNNQASIGYGGSAVGFKTSGGGDSGSAARFFYTAKADSDDRLGSRHPTVKPLDLIQWLCRLITPPRGHILDPFAGTGTTAEAALREGFRCTLIEREVEYLADIDRRMALVFEGDVGRSVAMAKLRPEPEPLPLFVPVWQRIVERHDNKPYSLEEARQNGVGCYEDWMTAKRTELG